MSDSATLPERDIEYFTPILPLMRTDAKQGLFGWYHRVVAVYQDSIVRGGCRYLETVHAGPLDPNSLASRLRGSSAVPLDEQTKVTFSPGGRRTRRAKFTVSGNSKLTFYVPNQETEHLLSFLRARLGDRLTIRKRVALHHVVLLVVCLLIFALAGWLATLEGSLPVAIALSILAATVGLVFVYDHIPAPAPWVVAQKKKAAAADLSHRRPFRSLVLGWGLKIVCAVVLFSTIFFSDFVVVFLALIGMDGFLILLCLWGLPILALLGLYGGHLLAQRTPGYVQAQDQRPPILYLRSFLDDRKQTLVAPSRWAILSGVRPQEYLPFPWRYILMANPIRILRVLLGRSADTSEEQLGLYLRRLGPFVAIGQPGERFSSPGAARMYVSNEEWKDVVDSYLAESQFVVLQPASTEGVWWEVERVLQRVAPEKVLFCLVNFFQRPNDYEAFQLRAQKLLGTPLPVAGGLTSTPPFLFFRADKTPCLVSTSYYSPVTWPLLGNPVDLQKTLQPFLGTEQAAAPVPLVPRQPSGISYASHFWASAAYLLLLWGVSMAGAVIRPQLRSIVAADPEIPQVAANTSPQSSAAPAASQDPVAKLLAEADQLFSAGKKAEAKAKAQAVLAIEPQNADAHGYLGMFWKDEGNMAAAEAEMLLATVGKPTDPNFWSILGQIQNELTKLAEAEASFSKAIELKADTATLYFNRGFVRHQLNRFGDAATDFAKVVELKQMEPPMTARACELCGLSLQKAGKVVESLPYFNASVQLQPDNAQMQLNRALAFQALGAQKFADGSAAEFARKGFEEVLRLAPQSNQAHFGRAIALQILGEHAPAVEEFSTVLQAEPKNDLVIWKRGQSHLALGHYEQAIADYKLAAELDPKDRSAVEFLVRIHVAQGRFEEALGYCRQLLATPEKAQYQQLQTLLLFMAAKPEEAVASRRESTPIALQEGSSPNQKLAAGCLCLLAPEDAETAAATLAALQALADAPQPNLLAGMLAVMLQLKLKQADEAKTRFEAFDPKQLQGPLLALHQLCQADLAAATGNAAAARQALQESAAWYEEFCPPQFAEGTPEKLGSDWELRTLLGRLYRDAVARMGAEQK